MKNASLAYKIGTLIAHLRKQAGFSQESFAHHCDIARTHMTTIERGKVGLAVETLEKLCDGLNLNLEQFFYEFYRFEPPPPPEPRKKRRKPVKKKPVALASRKPAKNQ